MNFRIERRSLITLLGFGGVAWPALSAAQQPTIPVVGFLASASEDAYTRTLAAFRKGLNEAGYIETKNLLIEYRWADFHYERLPALAAELAKRPVNAIFATGGIPSALAAKSATTSIPIVFANGSDPVDYGLVASLNRPGGNVTGVTFINSQLVPKRLQLLKLLNAKTAVIALLVNPKNPNTAEAKASQAAGRTIGISTVVVEASTETELRTAFDQAVSQHADAMLVNVDPLFNDNGEYRIIELAAAHKLPTMTGGSTFPRRGGLISYGADTSDLNRQAGVYVARILRGEKPADLPVIQPATFALRINLKAAKALGLSIAEPFLLLADEIIE
jgi:putative ABC transport system substrate-binding protein